MAESGKRLASTGCSLGLNWLHLHSVVKDMKTKIYLMQEIEH